MNILWVGAVDASGACMAYCNAINKGGEHNCRLVTQFETRGFDSDIVIQRDMWSIPDGRTKEDKIEEFKSLVEKADVVIFNAALFPGIGSSYSQVVSDTYEMQWYGINWYDYIDKKKFFVFFSGSCSLRGNYQYYIDLHTKYNIPIITCQTDVYKNIKNLAENITYLPNLINNNHPRYLRTPSYEEKIHIVHSPTDRRVKNTSEFTRVCRRLKREFDYLDFSLIENKGYNESIVIKQNSQIGFDHMQGYYSLSSVENGCLGLINVVGLSEWGIEFIEDSIGGGSLPWVTPRNEEELYANIKYLVEDRERLYQLRLQSYNWHHKYWRDDIHIKKLINVLGGK